MSRTKPKFKPEITRVKLNPEQAVLLCGCYGAGLKWAATIYWSGNGPWTCSGYDKVTWQICAPAPTTAAIS